MTNYNESELPKFMLFGLIAIAIGYGVDLWTGFQSNYPYLLTLILPFIFMSISKYKFSSAKIWRHRIISFTTNYLFLGGLMGLIKISLEGCQYIKEKTDINYISITLGLIIFTFFGDKIVSLYYKCLEVLGIVMMKEHILNQNHIRLLIYVSYLLLSFIVFSTDKSYNSQLWLNTFATFVALDRVKSNWHLIKDKNFNA